MTSNPLLQRLVSHTLDLGVEGHTYNCCGVDVNDQGHHYYDPDDGCDCGWTILHREFVGSAEETQSVDDHIAWFAEMVRRLAIDESYDRTIVLHIPTAKKLVAAIERLRGIQPELPPREPDGEGLPRYGIRWNGPTQPLAVPMSDGYWTPWHLADRLHRQLLEHAEVCSESAYPVSDRLAVETTASHIPIGWRLVPETLTSDMQHAQYHAGGRSTSNSFFEMQWAAVLAAAPTLTKAPFPYPCDRIGWICSVCHQWNHPKDKFCSHESRPATDSPEEPTLGIAPPTQCSCPYVSPVTSLVINPACPVHGASEKATAPQPQIPASMCVWRSGCRNPERCLGAGCCQQIKECNE
jgi:hypothetical protein